MESGITWYTCGATLHRTGHAQESSKRNAAGDLDSPRKQVQSSARIQAEVSRVRMLHCYRQRYWLSSRYGRWPSAKWWIQWLKSAHHSSHLSAQTCVDGRAHITVVTFLHKRVFRPKALVVNWHNPREEEEHMAHGRVLWLDAMTHVGERICIIYILPATAGRPDLQRHVNTHIQAEMQKSEGRRRIMGGDLKRQRRVQDIPSQQSLILRK